MVDAAIDRAHAYADAGASGFFVPGLVDLALIERADRGHRRCRSTSCGCPASPTAARSPDAGVARISHGPGPYRAAIAGYEAGLRAAMA